jgi:DNA ligase-1
MTTPFFDLCDDRTPSVYTTPTLYKLDSLGKLRTWRMELDDNGRYRTLAGLADGKQAESGWTTPVGKQGRNQKEQGEFEVRAAVKHQLDREYHDSPDTVGVPKMIEPMLAKTYDKWPGPGYAQPKLDGIRCIMDVNGMWTRQGQPITAVPHLHAACAPLFVADPDLVLDGELYNHDLREDFGAISSIVRKKNPTADQLVAAEAVMQYHVYDLVEPKETFRARNEHLTALLAELDCDWIVGVPTCHCATTEEADMAYGEAVSAGYEGGMYRLDATYEIGRRSKTLLKRKEFVTKEFQLLRLEEGNGNWAGAAKRAVLQNDEGACGEFGAGIRGSYTAGQKLLTDARRINDKSTATVRFFMRSPDGVPRFPVVVDIQFDGRLD